jgi:hypothetical protein
MGAASFVIARAADRESARCVDAIIKRRERREASARRRASSAVRREK